MRRADAWRWHRIGVAGAWAAIIGGYQLWAWRSGLGPGETVRRLVEAIQGSPWGLAVYVGLYTVRPLLLFSATVLSVAGGFLFGAWLGLVVVVVASNTSAMLAYGVGRWFGTATPVDAPPSGRLGRYARRLGQGRVGTIAVLRLLPVPYDLVSYLAGFVRVRPLEFLAGTAIGGLPGTVVLVLFGASITRFNGGVPSVDVGTVAVAAALLAGTLVLMRVVRRREGVADAG